jgi:hypothetical protein
MTQRDSGTYIQAGCGFFVLAAIFIASFLIIFGKNQADHFWDGGIRVEGIVLTIDAETTNLRGGGKRIDSENVQFEYLVKGQIFRHRQRFYFDTSLYVGQSVSVIYLPKTPWVAEIQADPQPYYYSPKTIAFMLLSVAFMIAFMLIQHNRGTKQKRKEKAIL